MTQHIKELCYGGPGGDLRKAYDLIEKSSPLLGEEEANSNKVIGLLEEAQVLIHGSTATVRNEIAWLCQDKAELLGAAKKSVHEILKISTIGMTDTSDELLNGACGILQAAIAKVGKES